MPGWRLDPAASDNGSGRLESTGGKPRGQSNRSLPTASGSAKWREPARLRCCTGCCLPAMPNSLPPSAFAIGSQATAGLAVGCPNSRLIAAQYQGGLLSVPEPFQGLASLPPRAAIIPTNANQQSPSPYSSQQNYWLASFTLNKSWSGRLFWVTNTVTPVSINTNRKIATRMGMTANFG